MMKKKQYIIPASTVIVCRTEGQLLAGSITERGDYLDVNLSGEDYDGEIN